VKKSGQRENGGSGDARATRKSLPPSPVKAEATKFEFKIDSLPLDGGRCEKIGFVLFLSFRRKPESSVFKALRNYWTPVFTGVTAETQFFHTFGEGKGGGD